MGQLDHISNTARPTIRKLPISADIMILLSIIYVYTTVFICLDLSTISCVKFYVHSLAVLGFIFTKAPEKKFSGCVAVGVTP
jgi:hypothetical protein